jgi:hypothetical protein
METPVRVLQAMTGISKDAFQRAKNRLRTS